MKVLVAAVKDLLVTSHAGNDIGEQLRNLEHAMELHEPGWCVSEEISRRLAGQSPHEKPDEAPADAD